MGRIANQNHAIGVVDKLYDMAEGGSAAARAAYGSMKALLDNAIDSSWDNERRTWPTYGGQKRIAGRAVRRARQMAALLIACLAFVACACSKVDDSDLAPLESAIDKSGPVAIGIGANAARSNAINWLRDQYPRHQLFDFECVDKRTNDATGQEDDIIRKLPGAWLGSTANDLLFCLTARPTWDYGQCLQFLMQNDLKNLRNAANLPAPSQANGYSYSSDCHAAPKEWCDPKNLPEDCDAKRITTADVARWLITQPMAPVGIDWQGAGVGEILVTLCALDAGGWGCPSNPDYPGDRSGSP